MSTIRGSDLINFLQFGSCVSVELLEYNAGKGRLTRDVPSPNRLQGKAMSSVLWGRKAARLPARVLPGARFAGAPPRVTSSPLHAEQFVSLNPW